MSSRLIVMLVALGAFAAPVRAGPLAFPAVDTNRDGFVTYEEARSQMSRLARVHYDKCDPDGDGRISQREYPLLANFYWMNYVMRD